MAKTKNLLLINGVCLPASCSPLEVIKFMNNFLNDADVEAVSASCKNNDPVELKPIDFFAM
jgi:hypothetical protein